MILLLCVSLFCVSVISQEGVYLTYYQGDDDCENSVFRVQNWYKLGLCNCLYSDILNNKGCAWLEVQNEGKDLVISIYDEENVECNAWFGGKEGVLKKLEYHMDKCVYVRTFKLSLVPKISTLDDYTAQINHEELDFWTKMYSNQECKGVVQGTQLERGVAQNRDCPKYDECSNSEQGSIKEFCEVLGGPTHKDEADDEEDEGETWKWKDEDDLDEEEEEEEGGGVGGFLVICVILCFVFGVMLAVGGFVGYLLYKFVLGKSTKTTKEEVKEVEEEEEEEEDSGENSDPEMSTQAMDTSATDFKDIEDGLNSTEESEVDLTTDSGPDFGDTS